MPGNWETQLTRKTGVGAGVSLVPFELKGRLFGEPIPDTGLLSRSRDATDVTARGLARTTLRPAPPQNPSAPCCQDRDPRDSESIPCHPGHIYASVVAPCPALPRSPIPSLQRRTTQLPPLTPPAKHVADRPVNQFRNVILYSVHRRHPISLRFALLLPSSSLGSDYASSRLLWFRYSEIRKTACHIGFFFSYYFRRHIYINSGNPTTPALCQAAFIPSPRQRRLL